jgi:hypothetical protein
MLVLRRGDFYPSPQQRSAGRQCCSECATSPAPHDPNNSVVPVAAPPRTVRFARAKRQRCSAAAHAFARPSRPGYAPHIDHEQQVRETWAALSRGDFETVEAAFAADASGVSRK